MPIALGRHARHQTKQEFVYQTLRDAIMQCELQPGERLVIDDLARRLHVSTIPVREAIQLLQSEGLVVSVPHTGATVALISPESIQDVFAMLEGLELVASRLVAERRNPAELDLLENIVEEMDEAARDKRLVDWADLNTRLHRTIAELPRLPMLADATNRVLAHWGRIRRYFFRGVLVHRIEQAQHEHHEIIEAMRAVDLPRLESAVRQHNRRAFASYMAYLTSRPNPTADAG